MSTNSSSIKCAGSDNQFKRRRVTSESLESVTSTSDATDATPDATFGDDMEMLCTFSDPEEDSETESDNEMDLSDQARSNVSASHVSSSDNSDTPVEPDNSDAALCVSPLSSTSLLASSCCTSSDQSCLAEEASCVTDGENSDIEPDDNPDSQASPLPVSPALPSVSPAALPSVSMTIRSSDLFDIQKDTKYFGDLRRMKGPFYYLNNSGHPDSKVAAKNVTVGDYIWAEDYLTRSGNLCKKYYVGTKDQAWALGSASLYEWISVKQGSYVRPFLDLDLTLKNVTEIDGVREEHLFTLMTCVTQAFNCQEADLLVLDGSRWKGEGTYKVSYHLVIVNDAFIIPWTLHKQLKDFINVHIHTHFTGVDLSVYSSGRQFRTAFASKLQKNGSHSDPILPLINGQIHEGKDYAIWDRHLLNAPRTENTPFAKRLSSNLIQNAFLNAVPSSAPSLSAASSSSAVLPSVARAASSQVGGDRDVLMSSK